MLSVLVEYDSRKLGGNTLLIPEARKAGRQEREARAVATAAATTVAISAASIADSNRVATPVATPAPKLTSRKRTRCVRLYLLPFLPLLLLLHLVTCLYKQLMLVLACMLLA